GVTPLLPTACFSRAKIDAAAFVEICWETMDRTSTLNRLGSCHRVQGPTAAISRLSTGSRRARWRWALRKGTDSAVMTEPTQPFSNGTLTGDASMIATPPDGDDPSHALSPSAHRLPMVSGDSHFNPGKGGMDRRMK